MVGIDCFTPYYSPKVKLRNLSDLRQSRRFRLVKKDILRCDLGQLVRKADVVFHLAAQPGVRLSWSKLDQYLRNNLLATQLVLESCGKHGKGLIFASSSSVYGDSEAYPTKEDALLNPVSPYGVTKQAGERLCTLFRRERSLKVTMLRYFTVYGPRQRPDMGIHRFIGFALKDSPLPIYGDGMQERDFTFVSDIVSGTKSAAEKGIWGETMNLGGGRATRLLDLVNLILKSTGSHSKVEYEARQAGDATKTSADISKARELLGYSPSVDLETGIRKQVDWQKAERSA